MERQKLLIDTSVLIDYFRKTRKEKTLFYRLAADYDFVVSSITEFEFKVGSNPKNSAFIESLLALLEVLPFDAGCVNESVKIYLDLKASNQLISLPDIFIAGTAIAHGLQLVTLNRKHFERISELKLLRR